MNKIRLPLDTKSLFFNILNDNSSGHTATVASPLNKTNKYGQLKDILMIHNNEVIISNKDSLVELLIKHSKTSVIIKKVYEFKNLSVNGIRFNPGCSFGCYIKEEIDNSKVQFGRLKLHYPSKFIYEDDEVKIDNKRVYKAISDILCNYAFIIRFLEYDFDSDVLNFDALIVGENNVPYSKVFINEKGTGNKFNMIFNENADDYDKEIIGLRKKYGDLVNTFNYLDYMKKLKNEAIELIRGNIKEEIDVISDAYPYSLFDFIFDKNGKRQYGILRITSSKSKYFNISLIQQVFFEKFEEDTYIFLVFDMNDKPQMKKYRYSDLFDLSKRINSIKYEED